MEALRPVLATRGITLHGAYPAGIDTDMLAGVDAPKTPPTEVAGRLLDGLAADQEDIFPDPMSRELYSAWRQDHKSVERHFAAM